jgi:hypothetical protein
MRSTDAIGINGGKATVEAFTDARTPEWLETLGNISTKRQDALAAIHPHQGENIRAFVKRLWDECHDGGDFETTAWATRLDALIAQSLAYEICICSAIMTKEGVIVRGHRHDDAYLTAQKMNLTLTELAGFITSTGRFVDRAEGARLQAMAGIVSVQMQKLPKDHLISEDLY